jgi:hypothetical protein
MSKIISFVIDNRESLIAIIGGVTFTARLIVKLTPTPKDDSILEKVIGVLKHVGLHIDSKK